jgi:16S rRNA (uracil1498-N3)-methyltransferase
VTLTVVEEARVEGRVTERRQPETEPRAAVWLAVALLKGEKLEWVVQKGTELGTAGFLFLRTERAVVQAGEERWSARRERYARIAREAAEQCGRVRVPPVEGPLPFADALARAAEFDHRLLAHEGSFVPLKEALGIPPPGPLPEVERGRARSAASPRSAILFVGPEGGFTPAEVGAAGGAGVRVVSLGARVLRAETAALALATRVLAALEEGD